ncbi:SLATT domain-containing protein [uncultured Winogradskyella sp.]|uniref:SLATT domain-containing protein n=1 Tax=uncultured Winogradskyella sp. TaxID=395353 RepID=UPI00262281D1|nr:SLATT domain-containing protein [uncultured Winogradskyella sp.]
MATDSQAKNVLEAQLRELYGRTVWTHKTQEKCADILRARNHNMKIFQIILSALTTTGILITVFGDNRIIGIVSAILSAILFTLNAYFQKYDLGEIAQKHSESASDIWNIREQYLSVLTDLNSGILNLEQVSQKRDELQNDLFNVYKGAPRTLSKAYKKATEALKMNEELTFSKEEINNLLPMVLRRE